MSLKEQMSSFFYFVLNDLISVFPFLHFRLYLLGFLFSGLGRQSCVMRSCRFFRPSGIIIGDNVVVNRECVLDGRGGLSIEDNVDIGAYSHIWTYSHDPQDESHQCIGRAVVIEQDVWIAARVTVLPGVRIGHGAVVGAGSVVACSVKPFEIVAGNPARVIGLRNVPRTKKLCYLPVFD